MMTNSNSPFLSKRKTSRIRMIAKPVMIAAKLKSAQTPMSWRPLTHVTRWSETRSMPGSKPNPRRTRATRNSRSALTAGRSMNQPRMPIMASLVLNLKGDSRTNYICVILMVKSHSIITTPDFFCFNFVFFVFLFF